MLTIPRSLALRFRAVLRRCARSRGWRGPCPFVLVRAGPDGLTLQARLEGVALRCHQPGSHPPEEIALPADALARFDGRARHRGVTAGRARTELEPGDHP